MTVHNRKLKFIEFSIGSGVDLVAVECQVATWQLTNNSEDGEKFFTQCPDGEFRELPDADYALEVTFYADWRNNGISDWLWSRDGQKVNFQLDHHPDRPGEHVRWTGSFYVKAPNAGGEARATEQTEVTFQIEGKPVFSRPGSSPGEDPGGSPGGSPGESPVESPPDSPGESPVESPVESPGESPVESPGESPGPLAYVTVFGDSQPGSGHSIQTDGEPNIRLANGFLVDSGTRSLLGMRLWIPATGPTVPSTASAYAWRVTRGDAFDITAPDRTDTLTGLSNDGDWHEVMFSSPLAFDSGDLVYVGYDFGNGYYIAGGAGSAGAIQSTEDSSLYLMEGDEEDDDDYRRNVFRIGTGSQTNGGDPTAGYAVDVMVEAL